MNELYPQMRLIDICDQQRGIRYGIVKVGNFASDGIPVIRGGDIKSGKVAYDDSKKVTQEISDQFKRTILHGGEIVINLIGEAGHSAVVPEKYKGFNVTRDVAVIPLEDSVDTRFIDFYLRSAGVIEWMRQRLQGSVTLKINLETLRDVPVYLPPICEQKAIAHILGTLDDKIELNRKTNETLESMAKALFKSWFVDFDPVMAKAEGRPTGLPAEISDLFPDSFEDSELGDIPSGWDIKKIEDIISRLPVGKRFDQKTVSPKGCIPVLDQSTSGIVGYHDEEAGVLATKDFPLFTFANHTCAIRYMIRSFSVIQNVFPLRGNGVDTAWLYQASRGKQEITEYKGHYPDFIDKQVVVPVNGIDKIFGGNYEKILIKCDFNMINSISLASIRDTLLPKLIAGEIRIPDAEKMLEEVDI